MIVFAVNRACDWEMLHPWMAVVLGKPIFYCRASKYHADCPVWGSGNVIGHVERMDPGIKSATSFT